MSEVLIFSGIHLKISFLTYLLVSFRQFFGRQTLGKIVREFQIIAFLNYITLHEDALQLLLCGNHSNSKNRRILSWQGICNAGWTGRPTKSISGERANVGPLSVRQKWRKTCPRPTDPSQRTLCSLEWRSLWTFDAHVLRCKVRWKTSTLSILLPI